MPEHQSPDVPRDDPAAPLPPVEIAAGGLQLLPATADHRLRAEAAGLTVWDAAAVWTAHDATSAEPRAFVVLRIDAGTARVAAVAADDAGAGADAGEDTVAARDVVRRYAREALGLADG